MTDVPERVAARELVVIDGGTGTEIQRRGGAMDDATWCAEANLDRPDLVRDVHRAYLQAGAELIIANTFATSPLLFATIGREDDVATIDRAAVRLAREAVEAAGGTAAVAGSISTMQPVVRGDDRTDRSRTWTEAEVRERYRRKAGTLAEAGVDVLVMEMMRDTGPSVWATEAAVETGLPVWVGLSFEPGPDGGLVGWGRPECPLDDVVAALVATGPDLVAVMHSSVDDTGPALAAVRSRYSGPLGAYPESGRFAMPDWVFVDVIGVDELTEISRTWVAQGVNVIGGCCGISPEHIAGLAAELRA
ncbi:MAG TPA: homocysteine S-methyltransferase family protein [Acidimicrobiales bacterium]